MAHDLTHWPSEFFDDLDRTGPIPLYFQVSTRLESAIRSGALPAGARLENEIAIAQRLGLSRPTVRRAIRELVDRGLLVRRRGIGTQVVPGGVGAHIDFTSLYEELESIHHKPSTHVISCAVITAPAIVAERLALKAGAKVLSMRRIRYVKQQAIAVLQNYVPEEYADITAEDLSQRGLYQILRSRGATIQVAKQKVGARRTQRDESRLLGIAARTPVLTLERVAFDNSGRPVDYGSHCYNPELYSFETTIIAK